jgi:hypothetical protein
MYETEDPQEGGARRIKCATKSDLRFIISVRQTFTPGMSGSCSIPTARYRRSYCRKPFYKLYIISIKN